MTPAFVVPGQAALSALLLAEVALGLCIVALALVGYRRNRSRPMLYLAAGIGSITLLSPVAGVVAGNVLTVDSVPLATRGLSVLGLALVLYSIALARSE